MSDSPKTMRQVLLGVIHHAAVTRAETDGLEGLRLDEALCAAAGFLAHERVEVAGSSTGARLALRVSPVSQSGVVEVLGPAAHHLSPGERVTLSAFGWMREKAAARHVPREVRVDSDNRPRAAAERPGPTARRSPRRKG